MWWGAGSVDGSDVGVSWWIFPCHRAADISSHASSVVARMITSGGHLMCAGAAITRTTKRQLGFAERSKHSVNK